MMSTGPAAAAPMRGLPPRISPGGSAMRAPTTPLATGDAPAPPRGGLSPGMLIAAKAVLGIVGLAGCVLVGAGGAWLVKHFLMSDPHAGAMAAQALPTT